MKHVTSKRALAAAAALALVGGGGVAIAAQGSSSSGSGFFAAVARHLGISTQKLQDATKAAALDQVDADLKAGRITKAQADALKARINSGEFPRFGGPGFGFGFGFRGGRHELGEHLSAPATYLGLTVDQLRQKLENGQSLADVAKAQGKSVDGLKQAMLDQAKKHLDQEVKDGELTSAQEKAMLDRLKSDIGDIVNGAFPRFRGERRFSGPPLDRPPFFGAAA